MPAYSNTPWDGVPATRPPAVSTVGTTVAAGRSIAVGLLTSGGAAAGSVADAHPGGTRSAAVTVRVHVWVGFACGVRGAAFGAVWWDSSGGGVRESVGGAGSWGDVFRARG